MNQFENEKSIERKDEVESPSFELEERPQGNSKVFHDNNFLYDFHSRPLMMRYNMNKILNICVNNDTLCLSKSEIMDYSLLVVINKKTKKVRFGIIDYVQHYNMEKRLENKVKKIWKGIEPTIVEPERYKQRFKRAIRMYFIGMCI